jgi:hypothetical protein
MDLEIRKRRKGLALGDMTIGFTTAGELDVILDKSTK